MSKPSKPERTPSLLPTVVPLPADLLIDSFGVRTSFAERTSGAYGGWQNSTTVGSGDITPILDAMEALGIRHVREGIRASSTTVSGAQSNNQAAAFPLVTSRGMKFISSLGNITGTPPVQAYLDWVKGNFPEPTEVFEFFEGPNEPNGTGPSNWPELVAARVKEAHLLTRTDPLYSKLSTIPLVNASIQGGPVQHELYAAAASAIGGGQAAENFVDYGCYHVYPGQAQNGEESIPSWKVNDHSEWARGDAGGKNCICTESGMFDVPDPATPNFTHHPPGVQNIYIPRMLLDHIYQGELRHYWFEMLDDRAPMSTDKEDHFGLIGYGPDYPVKETYKTMKYLFDLTKDPGHLDFAPRALKMSVTGTGSDYRQILFKKQGTSGNYYLCMWRDVSIWDKYTSKIVDVTPVTVTVTFANAKPLTLHYPSRQTRFRLGTVPTLSVDLRGEVVVVEVG